MSNTSWIERYVMPVALRIAGQKHVLSVRDGIILNMPFMLIGSFFLIFAYLPIPGYADMMSGLFGEVWRDKMLYPCESDLRHYGADFQLRHRLPAGGEVSHSRSAERWGDVAGGLHDDDPAEHAVYAGTRRGGGD